MANVGIYDMTDTWNNAGTAFTAIKMNVTDTASASGSKLLDIQKGGSSYLELNKSGELGILDKIFHLGDTNTAIRFPAADTVTVETAGSERLRIDSSGKLLIGTSTPTSGAANQTLVLEVKGASPADTLSGQLCISSTETTGAIDTGGALTFVGNDGAAVRTAGFVRGLKENGASGDYSYYMSFGTRANGGLPTERMRITSGGYLRMASGTGGIQFNGDTAAANALDDYEEGTFTPTYAFSTSGSVTESSNYGSYTKIGDVVFFQIKIATSALSSPSGNATIAGLPFTSKSDSTNQENAVAVGDARLWNTDMPNIKASIDNNSAVISLSKNATNTNTSSVVGSDFAGSVANVLVLSGFYKAA